MDIFGAVFVRIRDSENDPERLRAFLRSDNIVCFPNRPFASVARYGKRDNVPDWLPIRKNVGDLLTPPTAFTKLSSLFEEVIAFYSVDDYMDYQHWKNGNLIRFLDGSDEGWDTVAGVPDTWEEGCFFSQEALEKRIADMRDFDELTDEKEHEIRRVWQEKTIRNNAAEPPVWVDKMITAIRKTFDLW